MDPKVVIPNVFNTFILGLYSAVIPTAVVGPDNIGETQALDSLFRRSFGCAQDNRFRSAIPY